MPNHIAIILDGNRRWAKRNLTIQEKGHFKGADAVENLLDWCEEFDIKIITLYVLSAENLQRKNEELDRLHKNKMRVKALGTIDLLPESIKDVLRRLDEVTKDYENHFLNIAIAYGGQNELVDAVKKIGTKIKTGELDTEEINKEVIESNLYTSHLPQSSPDMILRTSGEKRMSGFLLWQSAYSELVFLDIFWPEFRKIDLMRAIRTFQKRKRRVGK